jgi:chromosomal replication initiation ATPase DnaA
MKTNYVPTANVKALTAALNRIHTMDRKGNRMALVFGDPGLGKTEAAVQFQANNSASIYLRAKALISPRWFLEDLVKELGEQPLYRASALFGQAKEQLDKNPRLVIVDEADYLLHDPRAMETLRDLHDLTPASICIIGMALMDRKLARFRHLFDRFAEVIKFSDLTLNDVKTIAAQNCEVRISDDAAAFIHRNTPRFRQVIAWLHKAEHLARTNSLKEITAAHLEGRK